jgi:nitroreductase
MKETKVIKSRCSVRKYAKEPVPEDLITDILECGRLAPSANNLQPWLIGAAQDRKLLRQIADATDHGRFIADAAVCFSVFCERGQKYYLEDGCAATMNILTACQAHGLGACWIAGDKKHYSEEIRLLLNVPEAYTLVALVPAGFPMEKEPQKEKKTLREVTFRDRM